MNLLFLCTGNTCRSPMAAAIFQKEAEKHGLTASVRSAGLAAAAGEPASSNAVEACREIGVDLSAHRSRPVTAADLVWADLILVMSPQHAAVLTQAGFPAEKIRVLSIADPYGGNLQLYRSCRDALAARLDSLAIQLKEDGAHGGN